VQAPEDGSRASRDNWWHWIYLEINFEEDLSGAPLVIYADSQSKMEQRKARHDVVEAAARALSLAQAVAKSIFFDLKQKPPTLKF
jgi:hypothetical protein